MPYIAGVGSYRHELSIDENDGCEKARKDSLRNEEQWVI
jgi:hypothetical protein